MDAKEKFATWSFRLTTYCSAIDPRLGELMQSAAGLQGDNEEVQDLAEILQRLLMVIADYEASVRAEDAAGRLSDEARWAGFDLLRPLQVQVWNALGQLLGPLSDWS